MSEEKVIFEGSLMNRSKIIGRTEGHNLMGMDYHWTEYLVIEQNDEKFYISDKRHDVIFSLDESVPEQYKITNENNEIVDYKFPEEINGKKVHSRNSYFLFSTDLEDVRDTSPEEVNLENYVEIVTSRVESLNEYRNDKCYGEIQDILIVIEDFINNRETESEVINRLEEFGEKSFSLKPKRNYFDIERDLFKHFFPNQYKDYYPDSDDLEENE